MLNQYTEFMAKMMERVRPRKVETAVVADDAPFVIEIMKRILGQHDVQLVGTAKNGVEAVQEILNHRPSIVFMDLVMPLKNGIEAAKDILNVWPEAKMIAFSSEDSSWMVAQALEIGFHDFLKKPFQIDDVVQILKSETKKKVKAG